MIVIAKTKLNLTLTEFWLMTPKRFYGLIEAWLDLNGKPKEADKLPSRFVGKDIVLDEIPKGWIF